MGNCSKNTDNLKETIKSGVKTFLTSFDRTSAGGSSFHVQQAIPTMTSVADISAELVELMFPGRCGSMDESFVLEEAVTQRFVSVAKGLHTLLCLTLQYQAKLAEVDGHMASCPFTAEQIMQQVFAALPAIRKALKLDAKAAFEGDPAVYSIHEIIMAYPFLKAMTIYRLAHLLYELKVPILPRMFSEVAHSETGIDIHPGATIGDSFFIDHGTGVVIGETTIIGDNVKLYQGVTLGALSFPKNACGELIRGAKRHPTIESNVTIYSNATILGDITIGAYAVIGSNVWIKESIPPSTMVMMEEPKIILRDLRRNNS